MTLKRRRIDVTFRLGQGSFGEDGFDTVKVSGLRCSATIGVGNTVISAVLNLRVWGLSLDIMNKLTTLRQDFNEHLSVRVNEVIVEAGDEDGMAVAFKGIINEGYADFSAMPDTFLAVTASVGLADQLKPIPPKTYRAGTPAALIVKDIAADMGLTVENSGVDVVLPDTYLPGDAVDQLRRISTAGNFHAVIDPIRQCVAIWPINGVRHTPTYLLSKDTGMVGYPRFSDTGIGVRSLFLPSITVGDVVEVKSQFLMASKRWTPHLIVHNLDAEIPNGNWFTDMECHLFGSEAPLGGAGGSSVALPAS